LNRIPKSNSFNEQHNNLFVGYDEKYLRKRKLNNVTIFVIHGTINDYDNIKHLKGNYFIQDVDINVDDDWVIINSLSHECRITNGNITIKLEPYFKYTIYDNDKFIKVHYNYLNDESNNSINKMKRQFYDYYDLDVETSNNIDVVSITTYPIREMNKCRNFKNNFMFLYNDGDDCLFFSSCTNKRMSVNNSRYSTNDMGLYLTNKHINTIDSYLIEYNFGNRGKSLKILMHNDINRLKQICSEYCDKIGLDCSRGLLCQK